jgi:hypothetical protein
MNPMWFMTEGALLLKDGTTLFYLNITIKALLTFSVYPEFGKG